MAMEPTSRFTKTPKAPKGTAPKWKAAFPAPIPKQAEPKQHDAYGGINYGDRGSSDRMSWRSHRDH